MDDSRHPGGVLKVAAPTDIPFTYLTCGQNVPDDLTTADPSQLAGLLANQVLVGRHQQERFEASIAADEIRVRRGSNGR